MSEQERVRPFHCGTQAADWTDSNCERCVKGYDHERGRYCCPIQEAIDAAYLGDGSVSAEIGGRMGFKRGEHEYGWRCTEFVRAEFESVGELAP